MVSYNTTSSETEFDFSYYDPNDPILLELKTIVEKDIDSIIEFNKARKIAGYVHKLFSHNGDNTPSSFDPLTIIKEAHAGKSFRCVEYSFLTVALLNAFNIPARMIGLKTKDVETREYGAGHVVVEFWSINQWVMCDVQWGIIPNVENKLVSAYEFGQAIKNKNEIYYYMVDSFRQGAGDELAQSGKYSKWVEEYLYFSDTPIHPKLSYTDEERKKEEIAMLVPLDVTPPKMFQGMFEMNARYTHSVLDFYPAPKINKT